jgi:predicted N-acetyltransferase YhbS
MTMIAIRPETTLDIAAREALLDEAFGEARFAKTAQRLRDGRLPAQGLSFVARAGKRLVGTVRLWDIAAGPGRPALLLGPLAVAQELRNRGVGAELMRHALGQASRRGRAAVLLVGDAPYYGRFGFSTEKTDALWLPGPYDRERLLACELVQGALEGAHGLISATGRREAGPDLAGLVAGLSRKASALASRAA